MMPRGGSGLRVSGAPWKGWWATLLVVATISGVSSYSPPSRAATGCSLTASRAQQLEDGLKATHDGNELGIGGAGVEIFGALIAVAGFLFAAPPVVLLGAAYMVGGGTAGVIGVVQASSATQPQGPCEKGFAILPDSQRQEVIALLDKGDTSAAMALVDSSLAGSALPPLVLRYYAAEANGFGGSRGASSAVVAAGQSPTGQTNSGGQTR